MQEADWEIACHGLRWISHQFMPEAEERTQIREAFALGTRVLVFDKTRHDPHAPGAYGATNTYDLPVDRSTAAVPGVSEEKSEP